VKLFDFAMFCSGVRSRTSHAYNANLQAEILCTAVGPGPLLFNPLPKRGMPLPTL